MGAANVNATDFEPQIRKYKKILCERRVSNPTIEKISMNAFKQTNRAAMTVTSIIRKLKARDDEKLDPNACIDKWCFVKNDRLAPGFAVSRAQPRDLTPSVRLLTDATFGRFIAAVCMKFVLSCCFIGQAGASTQAHVPDTTNKPGLSSQPAEPATVDVAPAITSDFQELRAEKERVREFLLVLKGVMEQATLSNLDWLLPLGLDMVRVEDHAERVVNLYRGGIWPLAPLTSITEFGKLHFVSVKKVPETDRYAALVALRFPAERMENLKNIPCLGTKEILPIFANTVWKIEKKVTRPVHVHPETYYSFMFNAGDQIIKFSTSNDCNKTGFAFFIYSN